MSTLTVSAQLDSIILNNPSFEDIPHPGTFETKGIRYWTDCGRINFPAETPPDLHSAYSAYFEHVGRPSHGNTYLAMVSRANDTYESVSQRLEKPLQSGQCYEFTMDLRKSDNYISGSKMMNNAKFNYNKPIKLFIVGGNGVCGDLETLVESDYIKNLDWETYTFTLRPKQNIRYITLEASFKRPTLFPYNGNILMDNIQSIKQVACDDEEEPVLAQVEKEVVPPHKRRKKKEEVEPTKEVVVEETPKPKNTILNLDRKKIKAGQLIEIKNLYFVADSSSIGDGSAEVLEEVYDFLNVNQDVRIEIGGHTNGLPKHEFCDRLSKERAKEVATYLVQKGISPSRLEYKGYGKRRPIASNLTKEGLRKNQRVEIKILSLDTQ